MSATLAGRTTILLSGDQVGYLTNPVSFAREYAEARALDALHVSRDDPRVSITWEIERRAQPGGAVERLSWQPGTPLPLGAFAARCVVVVTPPAP